MDYVDILLNKDMYNLSEGDDTVFTVFENGTFMITNSKEEFLENIAAMEEADKLISVAGCAGGYLGDTRSSIVKPNISESEYRMVEYAYRIDFLKNLVNVCEVDEGTEDRTLILNMIGRYRRNKDLADRKVIMNRRMNPSFEEVAY